MADDLPHLELPVSIVGSRFATVDQDTSSEVACCVQAIVSFPKGFRAERPDFGVYTPELQTIPVDTSVMESDIRNWEPRAELLLVQEPFIGDDPGAVRLTIEVTTAGAG